jgi:hypothetical protein
MKTPSSELFGNKNTLFRTFWKQKHPLQKLLETKTLSSEVTRNEKTLFRICWN